MAAMSKRRRRPPAITESRHFGNLASGGPRALPGYRAKPSTMEPAQQHLPDGYFIRLMREEASQLMPGQQLFTYDWD